MKINESAENYLETILLLQQRNGRVRSIDIANELSFSKPSVSIAMKNLKEDGFITMDTSNGIILTKSGLEIAEKILERHQLLTNMLISLGVDQETAQEDGCKIEHYISDTSISKIKDYLDKNRPNRSRSGDIDVVLL